MKTRRASKLDREADFFNGSQPDAFTFSHIHRTMLNYKLAWDGNFIQFVIVHGANSRVWFFISGKLLITKLHENLFARREFRAAKTCEGKKFSLLCRQCAVLHNASIFMLFYNWHPLITEKPARRKSQVQVYEKANRERQTSEEITIELSHRLEAVLGLVSSAARAVINCDLPCTHFCE